jgi:hypothetical protein
MTADFIRGDGTSYTGISLGGLYEFGNNFGLTAQYFNSNSAIVKAKNIYSNNILSLELFTKEVILVVKKKQCQNQ